MNVEYRRDLQNSYLVLITEHQELETSYALRMITENQITGLLRCERKLLNNNTLYYYDVTNQISLEECCKIRKIHGQEILSFMNQFLKVLLKLEEYLLSENSVCLLPQYIYMNESNKNISFCYVPGETWDVEVQIRELMEYLLPYLEHNHQDSMVIGYGIYHYILREKFSVDGLYAQLNLYQRLNQETNISKENDKLEVKQVIVETPKDDQQQELWGDIWQEEEKIENKKGYGSKYWFIMSFAIIAVIWALLGWFFIRNFKGFLWIWLIIGIVLVGLFLFFGKKIQRKNDETIEDEKLIITPKEAPVECYTEVLSSRSEKTIYVLKNAEQVIPLNGKEIYLIGREENLVDIVINSKVVSRKHAQIRIGKDRCFLSDLYSKNGILVNGMEIPKGEEVELLGGEELQFADVIYFFHKEN